MISAKERVSSVEKNRPLAELIPWAVMLTPDLVLCKDGSLLAGFSFDGRDTEGRAADEIAADSYLLERALNRFGSSRVMMWWTVRRDKIDGWVSGEFKDPVINRVDQAARKNWDKKSHYINRRFVWILMAPPTPAETLVTRLIQDGARGFVGALIPWIRATISGYRSFEGDSERLVQRINDAESLFEKIPTLFPSANFRRLKGNRFLGWLNALASPAESYHPVEIRSGLEGVDDALGENTLSETANSMIFQGNTRTVHVVALSIKTLPESWPEYVEPGILDEIINVECECVFSIGVRFMDSQEARATVKQRRQHLMNWRKGMGSYIKEGLMKIESDQVDSDMDVYAKDADQALLDLTKSPVAGHIFPCIYVRAESKEKLDRAVADVTKAFHNARFEVVRERLHQISSWAGTLPGQWALPVRWTYASAAAIADFAPIRGGATGSPINRHLSREMGGKQPALCTFPTRGMEPYWLEPHLRDVGHGIILGPTGMGKSVFGGYLAMRWQQYPRAKTIIFDKDRSLYKMVLLTGGQYLGETGTIKINPFTGLKTNEDWNWVKGFVAELLTPEDGRLEPADINDIDKACERVRSIDEKLRRMRSLYAFLPQRLIERLKPWIANGRYAGYFDHAEDAMTLGSIVGIAMDEVMRHKVAARAFMDLSFFRISKMLDGSPVYIHIEEGWFLLEDEQFEHKLNDWLRTLRKLNGIVVFSSQALDEIAESKSFAGLSAVANRFMLPNPSVLTQAAVYKDKLGLTDEQLEIIKTGKPKGEVILIRDGRTRVLDTTVTPEALALLRADTEADEVFKTWRESNDADWRMGYVNEMVKRQKRDY